MKWIRRYGRSLLASPCSPGTPERRRALLALTALIVASSSLTSWASGEEAESRVLRAKLRPARIGVGEIARLEIDVRTPAGRRVSVAPASSLPGLRLLSIDSAPVERRSTFWLHRIAVSLRPEEPGPHRWPPTRLVVAALSGPASESTDEPVNEERMTLEVPEQELVAESILATYPRGQTPFGLRASTALADRVGHPLLGWAALAAATLATWRVAVLWRRRRRPIATTSHDERTEQPDLRPWAERELSRARAVLVRDPREASNIGARVLRRCVAASYAMNVRASTTEELETSNSDPNSSAAWAEVIRILRQLDRARFEPDRSVGARSSDTETPIAAPVNRPSLQIAQCLDHVQSLVVTLPAPEAPRS